MTAVLTEFDSQRKSISIYLSMSRKEHTIKKAERSAASARWGGEALRAAALPEAQSPNYPCITLLADRHLEVENHCGVLEIGCYAVRLKTAIGILRIEGNALEIRCAEKTCVLIDGCIRGVCYENSH